MKLKSIDLITENSSGSKRVFFTLDDNGTDYEHYIDCPLGMTDTPEQYVTKNLEKIATSIQAESALEYKQAYKHPSNIKKLKEIESAVTVEDKVDLILTFLKQGI